jgi:ABC-type Na+ efflux pump permease subunit
VKKSLKIKLIVAAIIVLAVAGYAAYMCVTYFFYDDYKKYLTGYTYQEGKEFQELSDSDPKVDGMVLVAENDLLKLYTNTTTTEVAVYDKRNGEVTYSNPVDRANDPIVQNS